LDEAMAQRGFVPVARRRAIHYLPIVPRAVGLRAWESIARRVAPWLASFVAVRYDVDSRR
jgi:hypothetical protein